MAKQKAAVKGNKSKLNRIPLLFVLLSTVPVAVLTFYFRLMPAIRALILSFTNATALGTNYKVVGFDNYTYMFKDKSFLQALANSGKIMAVTPFVTIFISILLAFLLTKSKLREKAFYRTVYFFPSIVSMSVIGVVFAFVFHPTMGLLNSILGSVGLESLQRTWLGDAKTALWCIAVAMVWQAVGYYMVMHMSAMDGISPEIYESATIDGASTMRQMFSITIPMIKDIIGITFVLSLSGSINLSYGLSNVMTKGGPNGASRVLLQYMYTQAFGGGNFGYAMAITVFMLVVSILLSLLSRKVSAPKED